MRISEVVLPTGDLAAALAFWASLGVPCDPADGAVRIGRTLLRDARDRLTRRLPSVERDGAALLLGVSEVGLVVDDGRAFATAMASRFGVPAFLPGTAAFQAVGDQEGLRIAVETGRPWLPTSHRLAAPGPLEVVLTGTPRAGEPRSDHGWSIRSAG